MKNFNSFSIFIINSLYIFSLIQTSCQLSTVSAAAATPESLSRFSENDREYWLLRREQFYRETNFSLPVENIRLLGLKQTIFISDSLVPRGHLPFWFHYDLFKEVFNKKAASPSEELQRQEAYLSECVRVLKQRILYRMLASTMDAKITSDADKFYWEKFGHLKTSGNGSIAVVPNENKKNNNEQLSISGNNFTLPIDFNVGQRIDNKNDNNNDAIGQEEGSSGKVENDGCENENKQRANAAELPVQRAIRLVRQELDRVESRNQVEHYLNAFNEVDGSAIDGRLPY